MLFPVILILYSYAFKFTVGNLPIIHECTLEQPFEANKVLQNWMLSGSAEIFPSHIRLTPAVANLKGAIWNVHPNEYYNWEQQISFHIHGKGVHLVGDGLALWYVKEPLQTGPVFGSKNYFSGLGIFIDTFANNQNSNFIYPYVSIMVNNGSMEYRSNEDGVHTQVGGCPILARNLVFNTRIAISYKMDTLIVYVDTDGTGMWRECFTATGVYLPTGYYFGISASTGETPDNHDIAGITTLDLTIPEQVPIDRSNVIPRVDDFNVPNEYIKPVEKTVHPKPVVQATDTIAEQPKQHISPQDKAEQKKEDKKSTQDGRKTEEVYHTKQDKVESSASTSETEDEGTSLFMKMIYVLGIIVVVFLTIRTCRKYAARRREVQHKRLY